MDESTKGKWGAVVKFPLVPVAAATLKDGRVLVWSAYSPTAFGVDNEPKTQTAIFNPKTNEVKGFEVTVTNHDMFCPGISTLGSGDILVTGGDNAEKTSVFDASVGNWRPGPDMNIARGYQASTILSSGEVFLLGGSWSGGVGGKNGTAAKDAEVFSLETGKWRLLPGVTATPILTKDPAGTYRADNHGWFFGWSNAEVFHAGPSSAMHWFTTGGGGTVRNAGTRPGGDQMCGTAVMYDAGKILAAGGGPAYDGLAATAAASIITLTGTDATVAEATPMKRARSYANSVVLPDGKVVITGGMRIPKPFSDEDALLVAEIWDPETVAWTDAAAMATPRTYHSVAVLLKDGSIFAGGGGLCDTCKVNHLDGEVFLPPYLFNADGQRATPPKVTVPGTEILNGGMAAVLSDVPLKIISIVRLGSATHGVNTDQRRIELCGPVAGVCAGDPLTMYKVTIPADPGIALPGQWFLFGVSEEGVPGTATTVTIGSNGVATVKPLAMPFGATPANQDIPMPPGTQLD